MEGTVNQISLDYTFNVNVFILHVWLLDSLGLTLPLIFRNVTITKGKSVPRWYKWQQRELCQVHENNDLPFNFLKKSGIHGEWEAAQPSKIQVQAIDMKFVF